MMESQAFVNNHSMHVHSADHPPYSDVLKSNSFFDLTKEIQ
ncbi:hypothetical protein KP78_33530 [Jeotgalibacillus soli]|uniref:Uncharacterized protein n=1 Tax=Jeotgalibacillus soli TaxID=889306 RepID=A0A0C2RRK8_9BACL|nr:hypothetical protein KP78_33530 [Jeotgalibacillus soli]